VVARGCHNWSLWKSKKAIDMQDHLKDFDSLELRGQVAPLVDPSCYTVMVGEMYIPSAEFRLAWIDNIREICMYKGKFYRSR
jgi:hypothetical protein